MEVVLHVPDWDRLERTIGNARNLAADETVDVEGIAIVVNGDAVGGLGSEAGTADAVGAVLEEGVAVRACSNTLERRGETPADLVDGVEVVSSAMGELGRLQAAGAAYVRP